MFGYCGGGYYSMHWAEAYPDRVLKVFLHSPICMESAPEDFDKFKQRFDDRSIAPPATWFISKGDYCHDTDRWARLNFDNNDVLTIFDSWKLVPRSDVIKAKKVSQAIARTFASNVRPEAVEPIAALIEYLDTDWDIMTLLGTIRISS